MVDAQPPRSALRKLGLAVGVIIAAYLGSYLWARVTHRLVFNGHDVTGAGATRGPPGLSTWELIYLPPLMLESAIR